MLSDIPLRPMLPAHDLGRARAWYEEKLGLVPEVEEEEGVWYRTGGTWFYLHPTPSAGTAKNTAAGWTVTDIEAVMAWLRERGVSFEEYDFGPMGRTQDGLFVTESGFKAAWFTDSEGNILELSQVPST